MTPKDFLHEVFSFHLNIYSNNLLLGDQNMLHFFSKPIAILMLNARIYLILYCAPFAFQKPIATKFVFIVDLPSIARMHVV